MSTNYTENLGNLSSLMLPEVRAEITLGKDVLPHFDSLKVKQYHDKFHEFTLVIDHDVLEQPHAYNPEQSRDLVGEILNVTFKQSNGSGGESYFKGIVTSLSLRQGDGYHGKLVLTGHSPDFLLDGQPHLQCFYQENLADIVDKLSPSLKAVQSKIEVKPARSGGVEFACQFRESNLAFLRRLAADLGEWFFYDGKKLYFGKPKDGKAIPMVYGKDSDKMSLSMRVKPLSFGRFSYDAASDGFTAFKSPLSLKGIGDFGSLSLGRAKKLFKEEGLMPVPLPQVGEGAAQSRLERQSSDLTILEGESRNHLLHPGAVIDLKFSVPSEKLFEHKPSGRYRILEAVHHLDAKGNYKNEFKAIPADAAMLPMQHAERPKVEPQLAVVTDNHDPEGLGRVRVKFLWQDGDVFTPFIRILRPDFGSGEQGGSNRGYFWIPEIGDQVLVQFFEGMPEQPYVAGALGHGKNKASSHLVKNHLKSISTRSGHTIEFNDADGGTSITVKDNAGNEIFLDTQGRNITITAPQRLTLNATDIELNAYNNLEINTGNNMIMNVMTKLFVFTSGLKQIVSGFMQLFSGKALINSSNFINIEAEEVKAVGTKEIIVHSDEKATINSKGVAEMHGETKNDFTNKADKISTVPTEEIALAIVEFRAPQDGTYNGEFGFDWLRIDDNSLTTEPAYESIIEAGGIKSSTYNATTKTTTLVEHPTKADAFNALKNEYKRIPIKRKPPAATSGASAGAAAGAATTTGTTPAPPTEYFVPYLNLYPKEVSDKVTTGVKPPFEATLRVLVEIEEDIDKLEFDYDKTVFTIDKPVLSDKTKCAKKESADKTIKITCKSVKSDPKFNGFDTNREIKIYAYPKGSTAKSLADQLVERKLAGKIIVSKNSAENRKRVKFVMIKVKTNISGLAGGDKTGTFTTTEKDHLSKSLYQSLIYGIMEDYVADATNILDAGNVFNLTADTKFQTGGKYIHTNGGLNEDYPNKEFFKYLKTTFLNRPGNKKYQSYFTVFSFDESPYDIGTLGQIQYVGIQNLILLKERITGEVGTISHEALHGLSLNHTHKESAPTTEEEKKGRKTQKYLYPNGGSNPTNSTDNIMSYHIGSLKTTWKWQWEIMKSKL